MLEPMSDVSLAVSSCTKERLYVLGGSHMHLICWTSVFRDCNSETVTQSGCNSNTVTQRLYRRDQVAESAIEQL